LDGHGLVSRLRRRINGEQYYEGASSRKPWRNRLTS
jgi:hypothetical protein